MSELPEESREMTSEDVERFLQLFAQHQRQVLGYIYSLVPHTQNAEDIFQKTSLVLWRKFYQLRPDGDFLPWACRVAHLEVCNFRRTAARDRLRFSDALLEYLAEDRVADLPETNRRLAALRECVKQLGPPQQELLEKAYADEHSVRQLAERLGLAVQTIYNRLFRLRRLLLDCVERRLGVETQS
jgi:RNA polymerase sigma-70 factor (ECF subfamily)